MQQALCVSNTSEVWACMWQELLGIAGRPALGKEHRRQTGYCTSKVVHTLLRYLCIWLQTSNYSLLAVGNDCLICGLTNGYLKYQDDQFVLSVQFEYCWVPHFVLVPFVLLGHERSSNFHKAQLLLLCWYVCYAGMYVRSFSRPVQRDHSRWVRLGYQLINHRISCCVCCVLCCNVIGCRVELDADHYGLDKVKERVIEFLAVRKLKNSLKGTVHVYCPRCWYWFWQCELGYLLGPILCFVGPPGVGKTSIGHSIAKTLGRRFHRSVSSIYCRCLDPLNGCEFL